LNANDQEVLKASEKIYEDLLSLGADAIIDDRDERAGVKLSDADLIGYPIRITVGKKSIKDGCAEIKRRGGGETLTIKIGGVAAKVKEMIACG
jgi:prolyl-tRNA synthetase